MFRIQTTDPSSLAWCITNKFAIVIHEGKDEASSCALWQISSVQAKALVWFVEVQLGSLSDGVFAIPLSLH